ncbi:MAG: hypothetical protein S4CHLAM102_15360 [Chlamydiia bacterium]|nr:hypothetical protein [Chlamydiia bacterium]
MTIILELDKKEQFIFSPLRSEYAAKHFTKVLSLLQYQRTIVLIESGKFVRIRGKAMFRIFWLLGGPWKLLGWAHILPSYVLNPLYFFITHVRWALSRVIKCRSLEKLMESDSERFRT